jgi:D-3-phosphoglycerate dehydrogenase
VNDKITVTLSTFAEHGEEPLSLLQKSGIAFSLNTLKRRLKENEIVPFCADSTGLITGLEPYSQRTLRQLPLLKCISRAGVGTDSIDLEWAQKQGIKVRNTPNVVIRPVVELTISMILALSRKLIEHTNILRSGNWKRYVGSNLSQKVVGVIGTGSIGKKVCENLKTLGANIIAYDIKPDQQWAKQQRIRYVAIDELLTRSDILSLHASVTDGSILGEVEFKKMKHGVLIVNTARGSLIDEVALCEAIEEGRVSGAGLDVFSKEPYHGNLTRFNNVILTPHIGTLTVESRLQMEIEAVQNLLECLENKNE